MYVMKQVRERALKLRLRGYSYNEINRKLGIPKSTLSGWFSNLVLSSEAQQRLEKRSSKGTEVLIKRNKQQTHKAWERARKIQGVAQKDVRKSMTKHEILLLGSALYWAEGYKKLAVRDGVNRTDHIISLTNADPEMIRFFIKFLLGVVKIPKHKIKIQLRLFEHLNEKESLKFWTGETGLQLSNFERPSYAISLSSRNKRPYNRLPYGTATVRVNDTKNFHKLLGWIDGLKNAINSL
jgi:hypothetical protein